MRLMGALAGAALLLTLVVTTTSAYLRLAQAPAACAEPCVHDARAPAAPGTVVRAARSVHRVAASAIGGLMLAIAALAWRRGSASVRKMAAAALLLTIALAALGRYSSSLATGIVLGNLLGGMALVGVLAWLCTHDRAPAPAAARRWAAPACALMLITIALGVLPGAHIVHGLTGLLFVIVIVARCWRAGHGPRWALATLAALQLALGVALAAGYYPVAVGVAHNAVTALLVVLLASASGKGGAA